MWKSISAVAVVLVIGWFAFVHLDFEWIFRVPMDCESIEDGREQRFPLLRGEIGDKVAWVVREYNVPRESLQVRLEKAGGESISWKFNNGLYTVVWQQGHAAFKRVWLGKSPLLGEILACYGEPEEYDAYTHLTAPVEGFALLLWYPKRQMLIATNLYRGFDTIPNDGKWPARYPQSVNVNIEMHTMVYGSKASPNHTDNMIRWKPWPQNLTEIYVEQMRQPE